MSTKLTPVAPSERESGYNHSKEEMGMRMGRSQILLENFFVVAMMSMCNAKF